MRRNSKALFLPILFAALLLAPASAYAQDYSYSVDRVVADIWINYDGSIRIEYAFTFTCDVGNYHIAAVDVALPTGDYRLSDMSADIEGIPVDVTSDYWGEGDNGVAIELNGQTLHSGETGTVHLVVERVGGMVYEDTQDPNYASTQFAPAQFSGSNAHGPTDMTVRFHLPAGVQPEEPRWHRSPSGWPQSEPDRALDEEGRPLYTWYNPAARPDNVYLFGASFPRQYVDENAIQKGPTLVEQIFAWISAAVTAAVSCCCNPVTLFILVFVGIIGLSSWGQRKRKMQYLPPSMRVEGVGIKRGLTAVEAAILLETPLNKIMTMILFGLLKKGAITVLEDDPLKIELNQPQPTELYLYEKGFLEAVKKDGTLNEGDLRKMMVALVKEVGSKMKGFSRKESIAYYKDIVKRAWQQVEGAETPEVRSQHFDEQMEWTMLDDDFDGRMGRTFTTGPVFVPVWWGYHRPWARTYSIPTPSARPSGQVPSSGGRVQLPTLPGATFAAGIVHGVQTTASRIIRNVTGFTGGVTQATNPPPKPSTSSSGRSFRSGGGGGCACACACACAGCACACAGGSR